MINVYNIDKEIVASFEPSPGYSFSSLKAEQYCIKNFDNYSHESDENGVWRYREMPEYDIRDTAEYIGDGTWS